MKNAWLVALVVVVLAAGCSVAPAEKPAEKKAPTEAPAEKGRTAPPAERPAPAPAPKTTGAAEEKEEASPVPSTGRSPSGSSRTAASGAGNAFAQLMAKNSNFRVDYLVSSNLDSEEGSTAVTWFYLGDKKRIDTDVLSDLGIVSNKIFETGKETIICDTTLEWSCVSVEPGNVESEFDVLKGAAARVNEFEVIALPSRTLLEQRTQCFSIGEKSGESTESYEACLTQEGIPLYVHVIEVDALGILETELTATSLGEATTADFEVPAGTEVLAME